MTIRIMNHRFDVAYRYHSPRRPNRRVAVARPPADLVICAGVIGATLAIVHCLLTVAASGAL